MMTGQIRFAKNSEFVMPVPDQVRNDGSGIQNFMKILDSGFRRNDAKKIFDFYHIVKGFVRELASHAS
jgi:hypothetical protein